MHYADIVWEPIVLAPIALGVWLLLFGFLISRSGKPSLVSRLGYAARHAYGQSVLAGMSPVRQRVAAAVVIGAIASAVADFFVPAITSEFWDKNQLAAALGIGALTLYATYYIVENSLARANERRWRGLAQPAVLAIYIALVMFAT